MVLGVGGAALMLLTISTGPARAAVGSTAAPAAAHGCTNTVKMPEHATTSKLVDTDVDGDGRADIQFYGQKGGHLVYGVKTGAGGVYTVRDTLEGGQTHSGWTVATDGDGVISVIDDMRTAKLYAFVGCRFVQPQHKTGGAYDFTLGGTSKAGTGIACNDQNGGVFLERSTAKKRSNGRYDVVRSIVRVSSDGRTAYRQTGSGSTEVRWSNLKGSDKRVQQARGSFCNDVPKVAAVTS
jgi:hypothetical protein